MSYDLSNRKRELEALPEGKKLINTINAHSYNTALKDKLFAEALQRGDALIPDGASIVMACRWLKAKSQPKERIAGWDLFVMEMERLNRKGGKMFLHGQQRKGAGTDKGTDKNRVSEHYGGNLFPTLQAGIQRRGQPRHHRGHKQGGSGPAVDRHDGTEAGEMDLHALGRAENPLPYGNYRVNVRLLCRHGGKGRNGGRNTAWNGCTGC